MTKHKKELCHCKTCYDFPHRHGSGGCIAVYPMPHNGFDIGECEHCGSDNIRIIPDSFDPRWGGEPGWIECHENGCY